MRICIGTYGYRYNFKYKLQNYNHANITTILHNTVSSKHLLRNNILRGDLLRNSVSAEVCDLSPGVSRELTWNNDEEITGEDLEFNRNDIDYDTDCCRGIGGGGEGAWLGSGSRGHAYCRTFSLHRGHRQDCCNQVSMQREW